MDKNTLRETILAALNFLTMLFGRIPRLGLALQILTTIVSTLWDQIYEMLRASGKLRALKSATTGKPHPIDKLAMQLYKESNGSGPKPALNSKQRAEVRKKKSKAKKKAKKNDSIFTQTA